MGTLTIRLDEELENSLKQLAEMRHTTMSEVARDLLQRYMAIQQFRHLRRKAMSYAAAAGYLTDDDVFRDVS